MNTNLSEIIFILDRSGSMSGLEQETIRGYNRFLQSQREIADVIQVTTVLFDNQYELLHNGVNIRLVAPITSKEYFTRGSTALLDSIGKTISDVGNRLNHTPEEERPGKVILIITTDGYENSSREFTWSKIRDMIRHQREKYLWEFIFLGANIDADETAEALGISGNRSANFNADENGLDIMYCCMESVVDDIRNDEHDFNLKVSMKNAASKKSRSK